MFSKSLFKQSCKANGTMWTIITIAVCFMLACVMTIAGGSNLSSTKDAIQNTIIEDELTAQLSRRALNYFNVGSNSLEHFDIEMKDNINVIMVSNEAQEVYENAYNAAIGAGANELTAKLTALEAKTQYVSMNAYKETMLDFDVYTNKVILDKGYELDSNEGKELKMVMFGILNPMDQDGNYAADYIFIRHNEKCPRYDMKGLLTQTVEERKVYRENYASENVAVLLSDSAIQEENLDMILKELSKYGVTYESYAKFGFTDYNKVKNIAATGLVDYRANLAYRLENIKEGETVEGIKEELAASCSKSLLASLPKEVAIALDEIGQADLYGTLIGSIFFKMAGLLLPIIYMIMTSNNLIAGQVDSGSMAYILSSSVKRRTVVLTQALYLVGSLFAMFTCTTITSIICLACVNVETELTFGKLILINLGAFIVMFAMSGLSFFTSCWFNRSKRSMAIGGGLNMFFLVATMLGLFGSKVLPSIVRMDALNAFNYVTIISLFDVINILEGGTVFIYKLLILVAIGAIFYVVGSEKFIKKDLPL